MVCLLHSGLSTAGVVDLAETPDWLRADPGELAASLAEQLPDLSAIDVVYWYDLGYVAGDQREPDQVAVTGLERMWEAILTQAGVGAVEFVDSQVADEENPSEYEVDPVELEFAARPEVETSTLLESGDRSRSPSPRWASSPTRRRSSTRRPPKRTSPRWPASFWRIPRCPST